MADNSILSRLDGLKLKYEETGQKLTDPEVIADVKQFVQLNKEYKELEPIIETSERYRTALANLAEAKDILSNDKDEEMREMARGEITELEPAIEQMEEQIKLLLIPKDPQDSKNAIMEIRGGTGGDEAAIFAGDLLRMYTKYIESKGWRYEVTSFSDGAAGGYKEVVLKVTGQNVYGTLKYESGVHRVQRVPQTETQGRVHTSAASVAVLPEAEEFDVEISMNDIRKDLFCVGARRAVGQHDLFGHPSDTHPHGHRRTVPGSEVAAQELRQGLRGTAYARVQPRILEIPRRDRLEAQDDGLDGRPLGQDPHLQLPAGTHHGPPHQLYDLQPRGLHGRRHPGLHRPPDRGGERRAPEGKRVVKTAPMGAPIPACVLPPGRQHRGNPGLPWPTGLGRGTCHKPLSTENHCKPTN